MSLAIVLLQAREYPQPSEPNFRGLHGWLCGAGGLLALGWCLDVELPATKAYCEPLHQVKLPACWQE